MACDAVVHSVRGFCSPSRPEARVVSLMLLGGLNGTGNSQWRRSKAQVNIYSLDVNGMVKLTVLHRNSRRDPAPRRHFPLECDEKPPELKSKLCRKLQVILRLQSRPVHQPGNESASGKHGGCGAYATHPRFTLPSSVK